jgi:hypothetical protein
MSMSNSIMVCQNCHMRLHGVRVCDA